MCTTKGLAMPTLREARLLTKQKLLSCAGSAVAFGKLHGVLASKPLALPGKNAINIGLAVGNAAAAATFLTTGDPATAVAALGATTVLGGIQGAHMTASIGGKTFPPLPDGCAAGLSDCGTFAMRPPSTQAGTVASSARLLLQYFVDAAGSACCQQ